MTQAQAVKAYTTIIRLGKRATGKTAFALFKLKSQLKDVVEFLSEEETKLIDKYNGSVDETGRVHIEDAEKMKEFIREKSELDNIDIDAAITTVNVNPDQIAGINIEEIEALADFVNFE